MSRPEGSVMNRSDDANDDSAAATSSTLTTLSATASFRAMAFGRNYYHSLGGMSQACYHQHHHRSHDSEELEAQARLYQENQADNDIGSIRIKRSECERPAGTSEPSSSLQLRHYTSWDSRQKNTLASCWMNNKPSKQNTRKEDVEESDETVVASIACTTQSTLFLTKSGKLYQTGMLHGRLYRTPSPVQLSVPLKVVQIAAGRHFCLARLEGGKAVVSWGAGHFGQLGVVVPSRKRSGSSPKSGTEEEDDDDSENDSNDDTRASATPITFTATPVVIERLLTHVTGSPCVSIAAGDWHALALTQAGRVWAWGANRLGQCGRRSSNNNASGGGGGAPTIVAPLPVALQTEEVCAVDCDTGAILRGSSTKRDLKVVQISAGRAHSAAIVEGGQVYCWGSSQHGQCGNVIRRSGLVPPRKVQGLADLTISQVSCGADHTMALTSGGRVFCWGGGTEGQLGLGQMVQAQVKPRQVGDLDFVAIAAGQEWKQQQRSLSKGILQTNNGVDAVDACEDGADSGAELELLKKNLSEQPKITKVFAGPMYSAAVSSSGHVYTWGSNDACQAGISTPAHLPMKDNLNNPAIPTKTSTIRELHCCTFDSRHNLLLPVRIDAARPIFVTDVAGGPNHLWLLGGERTILQQDMVVGQTLHEVQEELRMLKLQRARHGLLSKVQGAGIDDGWTEETMTQTENEETTQEDASVSNYQHDLAMSPTVMCDTAASDALASEADTSRAYSSASVTPVGVHHWRRPVMTPTVIEDEISKIEAVNVSPYLPSSLSPNNRASQPNRRRFSLPKMFSRLSLGKQKAPSPSEPMSEPRNASLKKRKSKRNSL